MAIHFGLILDFIESKHKRASDGKFTHKEASAIAKEMQDTATSGVGDSIKYHTNQVNSLKKKWLQSKAVKAKIQKHVSEITTALRIQPQLDAEYTKTLTPSLIKHIKKNWRKDDTSSHTFPD